LGWFVWRTLRRFAGPGDYDTLIDVGGGEGYFAARWPGAGRRVVVDCVASALAVARARGLAAVVGDARRLPLRGGAADVVLFSDVLEHLAPGDVAVALAEAARVMKPGAVALVNSSCFGVYLRRWLRPAPGQPRLDADDLADGHHSRLTPREWKAAFTAAGLTIRRRRYFKHLFQPLAALLVRRRAAGGSGGRRENKEELLRRPWARAANAVRIWLTAWDAFLFNFVPGGAVIYKLEK